MNYAIIDIGSNTIKMTVFSEKLLPVYKSSRAARLLSYVKNGVLSKDGEGVLLTTLSDFKKEALSLGPTKLYAFATASFRAISNPLPTIERVRESLGIKVDLLSGDEEAKISFDGVVGALGENGSGLLFDMGGGSTEIIAYEDREIKSSVSMPFGALSLYRDFVSDTYPSVKEIDAITEYVKKIGKPEIEGALRHSHSCSVMVIGGSFRALAVVISELFGSSFSPDSPYIIRAHELDLLIKRFSPVSSSDASIIEALIPDRKTNLVPALISLYVFALLTGANEITLSPYGAREGYLLKIKDEKKGDHS